MVSEEAEMATPAEAARPGGAAGPTSVEVELAAAAAAGPPPPPPPDEPRLALEMARGWVVVVTVWDEPADPPEAVEIPAVSGAPEVPLVPVPVAGAGAEPPPPDAVVAAPPEKVFRPGGA